ncbi:DUF6188 family protein [Nocardia ignorata]|uniref:Uncharacterized protein n=1 Tax=Nocardia ignorata TaxID=145285 RepID=A0A4V6PUU8_NOCIG|nr:DUF6188 family protein [Nocardia ignorata]TDP42309.1 hypothetical protein DFR75_1011419 [Nocardia ignorata]
MNSLPIIGLLCKIKTVEPMLSVDLGAGKYQLMAESGVAVRSTTISASGEEPAEIEDALVAAIDNRLITSAHIGQDGSLSMRLANDVDVTFLPDPDYESWWIVGTDGFRVVCLPGGGLAEWDPEPVSNDKHL